MAKKINITAQLNAATTDGILADAGQIFDTKKGKFQEQVNEEFEDALEEAITSEETDMVVESIEEGIVHNALRKTKQILTEAEKYQARHNISAITAEEAEKIAQDKINETSVSSPDKLQAVKELSSWLEDNPDSAATMNAAIQDNAADIQRLYRGTGIDEYSQFSTGMDYAVGTIILYDGAPYKFVAEHVKGTAWDWNEVVDWSEKKEREEKVAELECYVENIGWEKPIFEIKNDAYISFDSGNVIASTSGYSYTSPIFLNKGDKIRVTTVATVGTGIFSKSTETQMRVSPITRGTGIETDFEYEADSNTYIIVSCRHTSVDTIMIKRATHHNKGYSEFEDVNNIVLNAKYYNFLSKSFADGGKNFASTEIVLPANTKALFIDTHIIESSSYIALINEIDSDGNLLATEWDFNSTRRVRDVFQLNENTEKIIVNLLPNSDVQLRLLYGNEINGNVGIADLNAYLKEGFSSQCLYPAHPYLSKFITYNTSEIKEGNGFWFTAEIDVAKFNAVKYKAELFRSSTRIALLTYVNDKGLVVGYVEPNDKDGIVEGFSVPPLGAHKLVIGIYRDNLCEITLLKDSTDNTERLTNTYYKDRILLTTNLTSTYYDTNEGKFVSGNDVLYSKIIPISCFPFGFFEYNFKTIISSSSVSGITFLDENDVALGYLAPYTVEGMQYGVAMIPVGTKNIVFTTLKGYIRSQEIYTQKEHKGKAFDTIEEYIKSGVKGVTQVGRTLLSNIVETPKFIQQEQPALVDTTYYDVNNSLNQYCVVNANYPHPNEYYLNKLSSEEIDFTPEEEGYVRVIMGKDRRDRFIVSYKASYRKGKYGAESGNKIEVTTDFVHFTTIWKAYNKEGDGLIYGDYTALQGYQAKELPNGKILVLVRYYTKASSSVKTSYFVFDSEFTQLRKCEYTGLNGEIVPMDLYGDNYGYDWHISVAENRVLLGEYGQKTQGKVWYSEDCGNNFKQVFLMDNHFNDGVEEDDEDYPISQTHIHGVFLDDYSNRMYIIAGETNDNIFYSDKGINTTDPDWKIINIRNQIVLPQMRNMQVVNGWSFPQGLVLGSDSVNIGGFFRVNRIEDNLFSEIEIAHEAKPNAFSGTKYCAAEMSRKDKKSPVLMCITRENNEVNEEDNEALNRTHLAKVVATYDGVKFFEIWKDDTYGQHEVYNKGTSSMELKKFAYCTRGMNAWQLNTSDDIVIKYSGRDYYFSGSSGYNYCYGDFPSKVKIIKNGGKFL